MSNLTLEKVQSIHFQKDDESIAEGAELIMDTIESALKSGKGCIIGRHGTSELDVILLQNKTPKAFHLSAGETLETNAGVFPNSKETHLHWCAEYAQASSNASVLAMGWFARQAKEEWDWIVSINPTVQKIPLRALEPYYLPCSYHWTQVLEGQKVCVVSSFAETMQRQVFKRQEIWAEWADSILPSTVDWSFVRSYYSPSLAKGRCEWPIGIKTWKDALDHLETNVLKTGAKIVLIGCGGLAMPLANRLAKKGLICVVMGGAVQNLFGIKGSRWSNHPIIGKFWNKAWVAPSSNEIPGAYREVEGGCYW